MELEIILQKRKVRASPNVQRKGRSKYRNSNYYRETLGFQSHGGNRCC